MNRRFDAYLLGWLMLLTTGFLCAPLAAAVFFGDPKMPFLGAVVVATGGGLVLTRRTPRGLLGSSGSIIDHSPSVSSYRRRFIKPSSQ